MLLSLMTEQVFNRLSRDQQDAIKMLFAYLPSFLTRTDIIYEYLSTVAINEQRAYLFIAQRGADYLIEIDKQDETDMGNYAITLRSAEDRRLLSVDDYKGSAAAVEKLPLMNLDLQAPGFYKTQVLLEHTTNGVANGDALSLLFNMYILVTDTVDA